jgi:hypothetical protein
MSSSNPLTEIQTLTKFQLMPQANKSRYYNVHAFHKKRTLAKDFFDDQ